MSMCELQCNMLGLIRAARVVRAPVAALEAGVCLVAAEDAAAQHEVTFRQWRENPAAFGIGDRYPVDEVFAEAKNAWQRAHPSTPVLTSIHVKVCEFI